MTHPQQSHEARGTLRVAMSVAATLCVLGLAGLVFLHAPDAAFATDDAMPRASAPAAATAPAAPGAGWTGNVPSADSVFRGKGYVAPEEPIAQF